MAWASLLGLKSHCKMGAMGSVEEQHDLTYVLIHHSCYSAESRLWGQEKSMGDQLGAMRLD